MTGSQVRVLFAAPAFLLSEKSEPLQGCLRLRASLFFLSASLQRNECGAVSASWSRVLRQQVPSVSDNRHWSTDIRVTKPVDCCGLLWITPHALVCYACRV